MSEQTKKEWLEYFQALKKWHMQLKDYIASVGAYAKGAQADSGSEPPGPPPNPPGIPNH